MFSEISIHSLMRGDHLMKLCQLSPSHFNPLLMRGELSRRRSVSNSGFQSTPHARGDFPFAHFRFSSLHFNPLPSCEGDSRRRLRGIRAVRFQSTPLMRGETLVSLGLTECFNSIHSSCEETFLLRRMPCPVHFNPLPSCEGRPQAAARGLCARHISIHSPHARGDDGRI